MEIQNFHPQKTAEWLTSLIECYQAVFADEPWNEWRRCHKCQKVFGLKQATQGGEFCPCGNNLAPFWEVAAVKQDILHEVTDEAVCKILIQENKVWGFCWGYPIDSIALEEKTRLPGLTKALDDSFGQKLLGYIDEVGVATHLRQKGWGQLLWNEVSRELQKKGCRVIIARSQPNVKMFPWWLRHGFRLVQKYKGKDERVIIARTLDF